MKSDIEAIQELVRIESVADMNSQDPHYPYGKGVSKALDYVLALCQRFGFRTKNCDNRVAWAEIGTGDPMTGILVHLDTVPLGCGWSVKQGDIIDGTLYGRGVIDNKGPAIICIYAMKELLDSGKPLKGRIRIIFGQTEEAGSWPDMEWYVKHEELPTQGFTPDADFPLIYAEKGLCVLELRGASGDSILKLKGGTAVNVVPAAASATIMTHDGQSKTIHTTGKAAHASIPENGTNAISLLMNELHQLQESGQIDSPFVHFYHSCIRTAIHGENFSCGFEDSESGELTMNAGLLDMDGKEVVLTLDIRYPVTCSQDEVLTAVRKRCEPFHISVKKKMHMPPIHQSQDSDFIQTLLRSYRDITGDMSKPLCIGGGTYARAMNHIVAFGPLLPGRPLTEHQPDEHASLKDLETAKSVYLHALEELHTAI